MIRLSHLIALLCQLLRDIGLPSDRLFLTVDMNLVSPHKHISRKQMLLF